MAVVVCQHQGLSVASACVKAGQNVPGVAEADMTVVVGVEMDSGSVAVDNADSDSTAAAAAAAATPHYPVVAGDSLDDWWVGDMETDPCTAASRLTPGPAAMVVATPVPVAMVAVTHLPGGWASKAAGLDCSCLEAAEVVEGGSWSCQ